MFGRTRGFKSKRPASASAKRVPVSRASVSLSRFGLVSRHTAAVTISTRRDARRASNHMNGARADSLASALGRLCMRMHRYTHKNRAVRRVSVIRLGVIM